MLSYNRGLLAAGVGLIALAQGGSALAQATGAQAASPATTPDTAATPDSQTGAAAPTGPVADTGAANPDIIVTGTNIRGIKPVGAAVVSVDQSAIAKSGLTTITDIARTIPQIQTIGSYREGNNTNVNSTGGSALNLRGLGASATLLLIDGKRQTPNGTNTTYTESNAIPAVAIERIEVIADGASAIYGSDAVAGVVNYVLRRKFDGIQFGGTYTSNRIYDEKQFSVLAGQDWGSGSVVVAYERTRRDNALQGKSKFLRQDLTPLGGRDLRFSGTATAAGGAAGNIVVPRATVNPVYPYAGNFNYYGLPTTGNGTGLTLASLRLNDANLIDTADFTDYVGKLRRDLISVVATQEIAPGIEIYANGFYNHRVTNTGGIANLAVTLPATTLASSPYTTTPGTPIPWYISGIPGVAANAPLTVFYNTSKDIGRTGIRNETETFTITGGIRADITDDWSADAFFTYGKDKTCGICSVGVNATAFQALVNAGRINPLSTVPLDPGITSLFISRRVQNAENGIKDFVAKVNGPLFDLPAGAVRVAFGFEHYYNSVAFSGSSNLGSNSNRFPAGLFNPALNPYVNNVPFSFTTRNVDSGFGEIVVPIVESADGFVRSFNLNGALRYDDYSDVGSTWNPKGAAQIDTAGGFRFRGTWGTSYRAPGIAEKTPAITSLVSYATVANNTSIPNTNVAAGTTNVLQLQGANPNLIPEKGTVWTLGVDWAPEFAPSLRLSATYYNIKYKDQLVYFTASSFLSTPANLALYQQYVQVAPPPPGCVGGNSGTYNPIVANALLNQNLTGFVADNLVCNVQAVLDLRAQNASTTRQEGIDFSLNYAFDTSFGGFNLYGSVTHVLLSKQEPIAGLPEVNNLDVINSVVSNAPVSWKGRGGVDWNHDIFSAGVSVNYIGSYLNNAPIRILGVLQPFSDVPSWTTFDVRVGIDLDLQDRYRWAKGLRINLALNNVTDKDPPLVLSTMGAGGFDAGAFDGNNADPFGRRITLSIVKRF